MLGSRPGAGVRNNGFRGRGRSPGGQMSDIRERYDGCQSSGPIRSITGKGRREDRATGTLKLKSETLILGAE